MGALARTHRKKDLPSGGNEGEAKSEAYRVVAVEKFQVLLHGLGEVRDSVVCIIHWAMGDDRESVGSVGLGADMTSPGVCLSELGHSAHQYNRLLGRS